MSSPTYPTPAPTPTPLSPSPGSESSDPPQAICRASKTPIGPHRSGGQTHFACPIKCTINLEESLAIAMADGSAPRQVEPQVPDFGTRMSSRSTTGPVYEVDCQLPELADLNATSSPRGDLNEPWIIVSWSQEGISANEAGETFVDETCLDILTGRKEYGDMDLLLDKQIHMTCTKENRDHRKTTDKPTFAIPEELSSVAAGTPRRSHTSDKPADDPVPPQILKLGQIWTAEKDKWAAERKTLAREHRATLSQLEIDRDNAKAASTSWLARAVEAEKTCEALVESLQRAEGLVAKAGRERDEAIGHAAVMKKGLELAKEEVADIRRAIADSTTALQTADAKLAQAYSDLRHRRKSANRIWNDLANTRGELEALKAWKERAVARGLRVLAERDRAVAEGLHAVKERDEVVAQRDDAVQRCQVANHAKDLAAAEVNKAKEKIVKVSAAVQLVQDELSG